MSTRLESSHPRVMSVPGEQYRARRYSNDGTRIDYILVDRGLFAQMPPELGPLNGSSVVDGVSSDSSAGASH